MDCPVCKKEMIEDNLAGVKVEVCENGCRGMWFDWLELSKLDEENGGFGGILERALEHPRRNTGNRGEINCPKCGAPMHTHKYQSSKKINVDECYGCGGFFLDSGELVTTRDSHMSEQEEEEYAQDLLNAMLDYQQAEEDLEKEKARGDAIRKYTRFLRLSYYVSGK